MIILGSSTSDISLNIDISREISFFLEKNHHATEERGKSDNALLVVLEINSPYSQFTLSKAILALHDGS